MDRHHHSGLPGHTKLRPPSRAPVPASDAISLAYSLHPSTYPPISSIPLTPAWRLACADASPPECAGGVPDGPVLAPALDVDVNNSHRRHNNKDNESNHGHSWHPTDEEKAGLVRSDGRRQEEQQKQQQQRQGAKSADTVLYLAYGSNMAASTFLGARGMRPLSQVNVACPALDLTFDLPGIPYREPCYSSAVPRRVPAPPRRPPPGLVPTPPGMPGPVPIPPFHGGEGGGGGAGGDDDDAGDDSTTPDNPVWDQGLMGVVYEITRVEYDHILADEGVPNAYVELLVPCYAIPTENPTTPGPEPAPPHCLPFLARTLSLSPQRIRGDDDDGDDDDGRKNSLLLLLGGGGGGGGGVDNNDGRSIGFPGRRLTQPRLRPHANGAPQPSLRYLSLLRNGAAEHGLPAGYRRYLDGLLHYEAMTWRQRALGLGLFAQFWRYAVKVAVWFGHLFADPETGNLPGWYQPFRWAVTNMLWWCYDVFIRRLFGEGERTDRGRGTEGEKDARFAVVWKKAKAGREKMFDEEEKAGLIRVTGDGVDDST